MAKRRCQLCGPVMHNRAVYDWIIRGNPHDRVVPICEYCYRYLKKNHPQVFEPPNQVVRRKR